MSYLKKTIYRIKTEYTSFQAQRRIITVLKNQHKPLSAIFYTVDKCASTFVPKLFDVILKGSDYQLIDYEWAIERLGDKFICETPFRLHLKNFFEKNSDDLYSPRGNIYGPLRIPIDFPGRNRFKHIFFLRDPRDVLVSDYFSVAYTHSLPRNNVVRDECIKIRNKALEQGIDNYVLEEAREWLVPHYHQCRQLRETSEKHIYLKYDLFSANTTEFIKKICDFLELNPAQEYIMALAEEANPVQKTEVLQHKRSGKTGQYLEKLQPDTIEQLNLLFSENLSYWEFGPS